MTCGSLIVMGVSGSGKSRIGRLLADALGIDFLEGDDFHPAENVRRMAAGIPLTDADRAGWLAALAQRLRDAREHGRAVVLACSALKRSYRDVLRSGDPGVVFVHLTGERRLIEERMHTRPGHFMPASLLASQLRDLQPPDADEHAITSNIGMTPDEIRDHVLAELSTTRS